MNLIDFIFYVLALFTLVNGFLAVTTRQIFRAAVFLLFSLMGIAGIFFWLHFYFIAAVQMVVYVGGIVVLIIFSIFLTQKSGQLMPKQDLNIKVFSVLATLCAFSLFMIGLYHNNFNQIANPEIEPDVKQIGEAMLNTTSNGYALPFEVASLLLLSSLIGSIVIAVKNKKLQP